MGFILQENTYVHRDDIRNSDDEEEDQKVANALYIVEPCALAPTDSSYSLESIFRQLLDMSALRASRHEDVCSLLRNLDVMV